MISQFGGGKSVMVEIQNSALVDFPIKNTDVEINKCVSISATVIVDFL